MLYKLCEMQFIHHQVHQVSQMALIFNKNAFNAFGNNCTHIHTA